MKTCSLDYCDNPEKTRGWCRKHYKRWLAHGDPEKLVNPPKGLSHEEVLRFHGWTEVPGPLDTPCWEWSKSRHEFGYGVVSVGGEYTGAHRAAYIAWVGPIPKGLLIRHSCDNPPCINPAHLVPGTPKDNMGDAKDRGRNVSGETHGRAKITWEDVDDIRNSKDTGIVLAERYGLSPAAVYHIWSGRNWKPENDPRKLAV